MYRRHRHATSRPTAASERPRDRRSSSAYFPIQQLGIVGSIFFGWRDNAVGATLFESRYTLELQGYPVVAGTLHLGLYGGGGVAYRWEDAHPAAATAARLALTGGAMFQLDINTRARAHGAPGPDVRARRADA